MPYDGLKFHRENDPVLGRLHMARARLDDRRAALRDHPQHVVVHRQSWIGIADGKDGPVRIARVAEIEVPAQRQRFSIFSSSWKNNGKSSLGIMPPEKKYLLIQSDASLSSNRYGAFL